MEKHIQIYCTKCNQLLMDCQCSDCEERMERNFWGSTLWHYVLELLRERAKAKKSK